MEDCCGTLLYYAPELVEGRAYRPVVDEWALGVSMHLLLVGEYPWDDEDEDELAEKISEAHLDMGGDKWDSVSEGAKDLLLGLLTRAARKRLTAVDALEHAWFSGAPSADAHTL